MAASSAQKNTIVRSSQSREPQRFPVSVRIRYLLLAVAEREAPGLGARLAARMWMTIPQGMAGASDRYVPFDQGVLVAAAWPDARLKNTEGLGHNRILRDPDVIAAAAGFLLA
jgi:hypothetical protein